MSTVGTTCTFGLVRRTGENYLSGLSNPVRRYSFATLVSGGQGDIDDFAIYAGESVGLVREILPASDIVRALIDDAAQIMAQRGGHESVVSTKG